MSALIIQGDARRLPLPDASVDLIVTSPPYYALRSYTDGGAHYAGQIGSEATPAEYIGALLACTREWMRVLKPTGSMFVNLGDTYSSKANAGASVGATARADRAVAIPPRRNTLASSPYKSLHLIPERYRIACVDQLGLTVRAVVIWDKPNGMPESVTDRVRRSHEDWVHLTLRPSYFAAVDGIREPHSPVSVARSGRNRFAPDLTQNGVGTPNTLNPRQACHELGRLPGSVWSVATEPLRVPEEVDASHYAAFPTEWPRRIITGWSPAGGLVLDPFGGTGTTALVADVLGRRGISVDMSADYCRIARWRTTDPGQRAKAARVAAPPVEVAGQVDLFSQLAVSA